MTSKKIPLDQLLWYLLSTFEGDDELVQYFDPACKVQSWQECCQAIYEKVKLHYPGAIIRGIKKDDEIIGYYVVEEDMLISFGLHKSKRNKEDLGVFWEIIKGTFNRPFSCVLYANNTRAIGWLQKAGMKILFDNVSILTLCPQED